MLRAVAPTDTHQTLHRMRRFTRLLGKATRPQMIAAGVVLAALIVMWTILAVLAGGDDQ